MQTNISTHPQQRAQQYMELVIGEVMTKCLDIFVLIGNMQAKNSKKPLQLSTIRNMFRQLFTSNSVVFQLADLGALLAVFTRGRINLHKQPPFTAKAIRLAFNKQVRTIIVASYVVS